MGRSPRLALALTSVLALLPAALIAAPATPDPDAEAQLGTLQVTATPLPEDIATVPASVTVVTHAELVRLGATDLRSALALVGGVSIAPGGEGGPASAVPEFQGLREFDAFLLLVDGVPWGGAFNPDLPSIDLNGVERIEILRGAAPVRYGATSFVGVINIIHRDAGAGRNELSASVGSRGSADMSFYAPFDSGGPITQSVAADIGKMDMKDPRAGYDRQHLLYRAQADTGAGTFRLDLDALHLQQDPQSPIPLSDAAGGLATDVPIDSNHNPGDSRQDEERYHLVTGFDTAIDGGTWSNTLSATFNQQRNIRGFLRADAYQTGGAPNADGFAQSVNRTSVFYDSHYEFAPMPDLQVVSGFNFLYGSGEQNSANFEYYSDPAGALPPASTSRHVDERTQVRDTRSFFGVYTAVDWAFSPLWDFQGGLRLNRTREDREAALWPAAGSGEVPTHGSAGQTNTRLSGVLALSRTVWNDASGRLVFYGAYRDTFKPAAIDFGPEAEGDLLQPETARAYEAGAKGYLAAADIDWNLHAFTVDFDNVVIPVSEGGLPGLGSGGTQRLRGIEAEFGGSLVADWHWHASWAYHDATYRDLAEMHDGQLLQLAGNRLVMSPRQLVKAGVSRAPAQGWLASVDVEAVGSRYYDRENDILAPGYGVIDAGVGYRFEKWTLRLDAHNLTDRRPAVSESELGPDQFYVMPARFLQLSVSTSWD